MLPYIFYPVFQIFASTTTSSSVIFCNFLKFQDQPFYIQKDSKINLYYRSQFVIFNPWKVPCNWIAFYQNSFVIWPGFLYHLIRRDSGRLSNEAFTSNSIVSSKQWFNGLKITNWFYLELNLFISMSIFVTTFYLYFFLKWIFLKYCLLKFKSFLLTFQSHIL